MIKRKKKPGLKSNPALPLIGFKTTTKTEDDDHVDVHYRKRLEVNGRHVDAISFIYYVMKVGSMAMKGIGFTSIILIILIIN